MIGALKQRSVLKQLRKAIGQQKRVLPTGQLQSVLLLSQNGLTVNAQAVASLAKKLQLPVADIWFREFTTGIKPEELGPEQWCKKHFGWQGKLLTDDAAAFQAKDFDLIVAYYWSENPLLDNLIASKPNAFRVGTAGGNEALYDLIIDTPKGDWAAFENELIKYLTILKLCP
ncbi:hypothetical protein [Gilvibacter sp.]|uniref:DUF6913 domain-containing protein n=1 Tax=Gilvibacter sp. TaxID=2729997 RepID=UPI0035BE69D2